MWSHSRHFHISPEPTSFSGAHELFRWADWFPPLQSRWLGGCDGVSPGSCRIVTSLWGLGVCPSHRRWMTNIPSALSGSEYQKTTKKYRIDTRKYRINARKYQINTGKYKIQMGMCCSVSSTDRFIYDYYYMLNPQLSLKRKQPVFNIWHLFTFPLLSLSTLLRTNMWPIRLVDIFLYFEIVLYVWKYVLIP